MKYNRRISFMLFIFIVLSGMCTRGSSADFLFEYAAAHLEHSRIESVDTKAHNSDGCTIEMLERYGEFYINSAAKRFSDRSGREMSLILLYLLLGFCVVSNAHAVVRILRILKPHSNIVILKYIHNKDGKK